MQEQSFPNDLDNYYLDVFGQQPGLNLFTQICFCFAVPNESLHPTIISTLTNGLDRLSASFPWVAGQIVNEGSSQGNTGIFKIKAFEKRPRLVVNDLRDDASMPTMDTLRQANFPMNMLDESIVAPRTTFPSSSEELEPTPVFLLQASFISGGLLLTFNGQHQAMDMTGQGQIIDLLSKACMEEQFTAEDLSAAKLDRRSIIPLLDDAYEPDAEVAHQLVKPAPSHSKPESADIKPAATSAPKSTWANVTFPAKELRELKSIATSTMPQASHYVSTDDVLSAFIWQSVARARLSRLSSTTTSTFARAVDPRRYMNIPANYPGLVQNMAYNTYALRDLVKEPLGVVASQLRSAVDPKTSNLGHQTRALATVLDRTADKNMISVAATLDLSSDIMLSSWANLDSYKLDFSLGLGKAEAVRRPQFDPVESLMYLMPKTLEGDIDVALCLRDEDMEGLRKDAEFSKFSGFIAQI